MARFSTTSQHLASAALKIAEVNHYMVGFDAGQTETISFDDFSDANQILIETEIQHKTNGRPRNNAQFDRAFMVLDLLCFHQHRAHLSR